MNKPAQTADRCLCSTSASGLPKISRTSSMGWWLVVSAVLTPGVAHAYIDPGSAGFVITTVLGAVAAAGYMIRGWLGAAGRWFSRVRGRGDSDQDTSEQHNDDSSSGNSASRDHSDNEDPR